MIYAVSTLPKIGRAWVVLVTEDKMMLHNVMEFSLSKDKSNYTHIHSRWSKRKSALAEYKQWFSFGVNAEIDWKKFGDQNGLHSRAD